MRVECAREVEKMRGRHAGLHTTADGLIPYVLGIVVVLTNLKSEVGDQRSDRLLLADF